ncbi:type II toxin-antitoxin system PemK/MazF family toxin [Eubacterium sp.]|uniref:type II toxin-antitoxin system PemK/MazF family toxin n=1 Tax=Eubacterium sp. TaxID=142586 RepID=UPI001E00B539|nr:type II toxin-antitoxin system PemK/MazF family toxin [Eubacterium sp.]MBS5619681.1 type II toxin-antitoxin system PemK/MazF family toxin [Eubacterium sp.]
MRELKDEKLRYKLDIIYKNIKKLKRLNIDNYYCANLLDWFNEIILKNIAIFKSKNDINQMDQELFKKERQCVYWIDFGRNIGSEFRDLHFAVVIFESKYTALVIPLTSKKDHDPTWIEENKEAIVDLGIINGFPDETKECYACTFMIQSVSKKRLSRYGDNQKGYFDIKLSNNQMRKICNNLSQIAYNSISENIVDANELM